MMPAQKVEPGLIPRLERLTGIDGNCCMPEYRASARTIARSRVFLSALGQVRALSDPQRLLAVALLRRRKELCACEIQAALGVTHATVSHHMRTLERAGVVAAQRRGKWMYYRYRNAGGLTIP